jgi:hypothetical protein
MAYLLNAQQRTQLAVERASQGNSLDTLRTVAHLPAATAWKAGKAISSLPSGSLLPGTLIATFNSDGRAIDSVRDGQTSVYLGHDQAHIHTLAPDPDSPVGRWRNVLVSLKQASGLQPLFDGKTYHVIE